MATNARERYCWIYCETPTVLNLFPPGVGIAVEGVRQIGAFYVVDDFSDTNGALPKAGGRPSLGWDGFHVEVADLIRRGDLPAKKESAIQYFQDWFQRERGHRPGRATIGEKLKPYYDRFAIHIRRDSSA
jgi:hypothetical protein